MSHGGGSSESFLFLQGLVRALTAGPCFLLVASSRQVSAISYQPSACSVRHKRDEQSVVNGGPMTVEAAPIGAGGCSHGWSSPRANGTRGGVAKAGIPPRTGRRIRGVVARSGVVRSSRVAVPTSAPSGAGRDMRSPSRGSASLHPWLQPLTPLGSSRRFCHAPVVNGRGGIDLWREFD